jgi:hypothetical protein
MTVHNCIEAVTCIFMQINTSTNPPSFNFTGVAQCAAEACADAQFFINQVLNCAISNIGTCFGQGGGGIVGCLMNECGMQISACIGSTCH